jgi:hypothetical protein
MMEHESRRNHASSDRQAGGAASVEQLRRRLPGAPPPYLEGALGNPNLGDDEMLLLLRNRQAPQSLLARIGRDRRWTASHEIKKQLVRHPRTPLVLARSFLPHLFWKDLVEVSSDLRVHPVVRRQAETLLTIRIEELSLGERIALSRRAPRGLIGSLIDSGEDRVLRGLLGNPRLVESDAVRIAASRCGAPGFFHFLAAHPAWGRRRAVRLALVRNPRAPVQIALRLVDGMPVRDLRQLVKDVKVPRIVRVGAGRRLAEPSGRSSASLEWR